MWTSTQVPNGKSIALSGKKLWHHPQNRKFSVGIVTYDDKFKFKFKLKTLHTNTRAEIPIVVGPPLSKVQLHLSSPFFERHILHTALQVQLQTTFTPELTR